VLAKQRRQRRKEAMERRRRQVGLEKLVQLVVERAGALHYRDVLSNLGQRCSPGVVRVAEALREPNRQLRDVGAEDRDDPSLEDRSGHVVEVILRRRGAGRLEIELLAENRRLELLQTRARLDPQLLDEHPTPLLEHLERLRLPAGAVEREHQLLPEPLAKRVLADERFELAGELRGRSRLEVGVEPLFKQCQPQLLEPGDLALRERLVGELLEGRPAPEG